MSAQTGVIEVADGGQEQRCAKSVAVLNEIGHRLRQGVAPPLESNPVRRVSRVDGQVVAASESRDHQLAGHLAVGRGQLLPHGCASDGLDAANSHFTAAPPLGHALGGFQTMEVVAIHPSVAYTHTFGEWHAERHIDRRQSPRHRKRRPCQEGESQPLRNHRPSPRSAATPSTGVCR